MNEKLSHFPCTKFIFWFTNEKLKNCYDWSEITSLNREKNPKKRKERGRKSNSRAVKETALVKDGKNLSGYVSQPFCSNGNKLYSSNFLWQAPESIKKLASSWFFFSRNIFLLIVWIVVTSIKLYYINLNKI